MGGPDVKEFSSLLARRPPPTLHKMRSKCGIFALAAAASLVCNAETPSQAYQSGFSVALKLGGELFDSLPPKFGKQIDSQAIALQPQDLPVVMPIATSGETKLVRQVSVSAGFIDLANHICHAKAIDRIQPGFFDKYVKNLAHQAVGDPAALPPNIVDARYWTDDVINDQLSYFNQMMGFMMAINLSHHYLGHYAKYSAKMTSPGQTLAPINNFLTRAEWEVSVKAAVIDELDCALATDGSRALFEAIDRMPVRPTWAAYIIPPGVDIKKLNKQLARYEDDFFHGRLKRIE
jgi:hypothetical protein